MKNKIFISLFLIITIFSLISTSVVPCGATDVKDSSTEISEKILSYNLKKYNASSVDEFINVSLTKDIGNVAEWYVIALSQSGKYKFDSYENALIEYVESKNITSATSRLKFALSLLSIGAKNEYIETTLKDSMGKQGIMSLVYGLHLINNNCVNTSYTSDLAVDEILSLQNDDGGWSLRGNNSDVDVTAMTVQALAPFYSDDNIKKKIDKSITFLSEKQLDDGDYISYGVSNPESGCQVIVALSSLGIDCESDERFIKNGNTLFDGILKYILEDGSFSHTYGGVTNHNATVQAFFASTAYNRMKSCEKSIYLLDSIHKESCESEDVSSFSSETIVSEIESRSESESESNITSITDNTVKTKDNNLNIKFILVSVVVVLIVICFIVLRLTGKLNKNNILFLLVVALVLVLIVFSLDIKSTDEYYNVSSLSKNDSVGTVTMTIECESIKDKSSSNKYIPQDGIILKETELSISEGDTVYSILIDAARMNSIHIENNGNDDMAYIAGINYLYEFDYGDLSGWVFYVNGIESSVGCSSYKLSDGDEILWKYTLDLGENLK